MSRPIIYIASPYTKGDPCINARFQCEIFDQMLTDGKAWPVAPLLSHFQHSVFPRHYQDWIDYDIAMLPLYDGCVRLNASYPALNYEIKESSGADGEVAYFLAAKKPVFFSLQALYVAIALGEVTRGN